MNNADVMAIVSEEMLKVAPGCHECDKEPAFYVQEIAVCYDCAPDKSPERMTLLGRVYRALERRFA